MNYLLSPSRYEEFVFTVKTDNAGTSNSTSFTLPLRSTGTYDYSIDWGDGVIENYTGTTSRTHDYGIAGTYQITIKGAFFQHVVFYNGGDKSKVVSIVRCSLSSGTLGVSYYGCNNLVSIESFYSGGVTNFRNTWQECTGLASFPLLDTSNGTDFSYTWFNCTALTSFPLINTGKGTSFEYTWSNCSNLTSFPLLDTSNGTNFFYSWGLCSKLTSFPLINVNKGTTFLFAWFNCTLLTTFPAGMFDSWTATPANDCFFNAWQGCTALTATSVENILVSIDTSGKSAPGTTVRNKQITISYNVATGGLTAATTTAIANLKGKNWNIVINGVTQ